MLGRLEPAYFATSYAIGFSIHGFTLFADRHGPPWLPRWAAGTVATACGMVLGLALGGVLLDGDPLFLLGSSAFLLIGVLLSGVGLAGSIAVERVWEVRNRLERAKRDALARDKALAEAELRVLQAQVEPHFLFNTLANVISLIRTHPDRAARLLERLTSLLRASLSRTRRAGGTLGDELAVVRAYLDIQSLRMAGRMTFEVDVEPGLEAAPMPPLLLQPLVENAVLHGIEPSPAGGRVVVRAERSRGVVRIRVTDDGIGLDPDTAGQGVGLASVRERLLVRTPISELAARLDPGRFWRIHRGGIVNVAAIEAARRATRRPGHRRRVRDGVRHPCRGGVRALDYLLKPELGPRLETVRLKRAGRRGPREPDPRVLESLFRRWPIARVPALAAGRASSSSPSTTSGSDRKYTAAVTRDREHLVRTPISDLAARLDPARFWRPPRRHRQRRRDRGRAATCAGATPDAEGARCCGERPLRAPVPAHVGTRPGEWRMAKGPAPVAVQRPGSGTRAVDRCRGGRVGLRRAFFAPGTARRIAVLRHVPYCLLADSKLYFDSA